ncbi:FecR family protein [Parapedobacter deserti]|uniref:FecR family protein n=1 Tax=Parapedobacter deserti TaxID=1912957 RepID=A0ABV7JPD0_9SPHI
MRKYREGKTTSKETKLVDDWYESFGEQLPPMGAKQKRKVRNALYNRIVSTIQPIGDGKKRTIKVRVWVSGIAASVLLVTAIGFAVHHSMDRMESSESAQREYVEWAAEPGKLKKLLLPDSTEIWLNAATKVGFFMPFGDGAMREITLIDGEAFFQVMPDSTKPFVVHAAGIRTEVLGTSFTVKSYAELDELSVSVSTGKVQVIDRNKQVLGVLHPGQEVIYNKVTDKRIIRSFDAESRNAWMTGTTYLSEVSFNELALVFRRIYGVQLVTGTPQVAGQRYSIQLDRNSRQMDVVQAICAIHRNKYRKEGNEIIIY